LSLSAGAWTQDYQSVVREYLIGIDDRFAVHRSYHCSEYKPLFGDSTYYRFSNIPPDCFPDFRFLEIDTTVDLIVSCPSDPNDLSIAVDSRQNVYTLRGHSSNDFNQMAKQDTTTITAQCVVDYGEFFLAATRFGFFSDYNLIQNGDQLIEMFEMRIQDPDFDLWFNLYRRSWDSTEVYLRAIGNDLPQGSLVPDSLADLFIIDYPVWLTESGELHVFRVAITQNGSCEIRSDSLLAENIGHWAD
jgi:hypothetical protein